MEYDARRKLIEELSKNMTGKKPGEEPDGKVIVKYDAATNSALFVLSGTNHSVEDMCRAKKYFEKKLEKHPSPNSERRKYYEVAVLCIDSVLREFTKPIDDMVHTGS